MLQQRRSSSAVVSAVGDEDHASAAVVVPANNGKLLKQSPFISPAPAPAPVAEDVLACDIALVAKNDPTLCSLEWKRRGADDSRYGLTQRWVGPLTARH